MTRYKAGGETAAIQERQSNKETEKEKVGRRVDDPMAASASPEQEVPEAVLLGRAFFAKSRTA